MGFTLQDRVDPEEVGFDSGQLARADAHLVERYIKPNKISGALLLVAREGKVAHLGCLGHKDSPQGPGPQPARPMTEDTLFRIYSMTKPITSVAVMMLYERGLITLDDPIERYLPSLAAPRIYEAGRFPELASRPASRSITICDLLTHTSGLTYDFQARTNVDGAYRKLGLVTQDSKLNLEEFVDRLGQLPLEFEPGTAWTYSVATDVLGRLVEVVSGQTLDAFFESQILGPLGMVDTHFRLPDDKRERLASCYIRAGKGQLQLQDDPMDSRYSREVKLLSGGGGLVSTAADYLRFCGMLHGGGRLGDTRLLGRKTVELMAQNHLPNGGDLADLARGSFSEARYAGMGFGLGVSVTVDPFAAHVAGSAGELGWGGLASTAFWVDPKEDITMIFLTQLVPSRTYNFRGQIKALVYGALK